MGWRDIIGDVSSKHAGLTSPLLHNLNGAFRGWFYNPGNRADITYHIPHDYVLGTDIFIHVHWTHNGVYANGNFEVSHNLSYAKGHNQMAFGTEVHILQEIECDNVPALTHRIDEIQISGKQVLELLDTDKIEPDGIITNSMVVNETPNIERGVPNAPMIICVDVHYQSNDKSTPNKEPNFYS
jgi:hypothetical protein